MLPTREEAWKLVCEWMQSDSLRKHALAVEAAMRGYARHLGADEELWGITGLVHDLDFERHPDMTDGVAGHPRTSLHLFHEKGWPAELIHAVEGHAPYLGVPRTTPMDSALWGVDELTGLIMACAYVRPTKDIRDVEVKSVQKKWKDKLFAAAINRADIEQGAAELGVPLVEHMRIVLHAMQGAASALGLDGRKPAG